jgi:hypothetical protein
VSLVLANGNYEVTARLTSGAAGNGSPEDGARVYATTVHSPAADPRIELPFDGAPPADALRLEIRHLDFGDTAKIHVRELQLQPERRP